jgi:DNA uptake protein and related DNA-binding proteins
MWKVFVKEYLSFTRKERIGIFCLLSLILACMMLPMFFHFMIHPKAVDNSGFEKEISSLKMIPADSSEADTYPAKSRSNAYSQHEYTGNTYHPGIHAENFYFDPNTTSAYDWQRLGIKPKTIQTIQKYVSRGGRFRQADDLNKIWGLHPDELKRLLPYVRIKSTVEDGKQEYAAPKPVYYQKPVSLPFDINTADSGLFIALPGIGSKLAERIIRFRDKLGGFISTSQVAETFGLPDSTFQKIKQKLMLGTGAVKKININTASLDEMKSHPYIRYNLANAIVQYRTQHGDFMSITDLQKIMSVSPEMYKKLSPYVTIGL